MFEIAGRVSVVKSFISIVMREISVLYKFFLAHWYVLKSCSSRNFEKSLLTGMTGIQSTRCNDAENQL